MSDELLPQSVLEARLATIRQLQRKGTLVWFVVGILATVAVFTVPWDRYGLSLGLFLYPAAGTILILLFARLQRIRRAARKLELTCPRCGGDLWGPGKEDSPDLEELVLQRGQCPHCHVQLFVPQKDRASGTH